MNLTFFFNHKLDIKYFHIKQFFSEKAVFSEETTNSRFRGALDHFLGKSEKGTFYAKN